MSRSDTDTDVSQAEQREAAERADLEAAAPSAETPASIIGRSPWEIFWGHFRQDKFALARTGDHRRCMILMAIFAPVVASWTGHEPNQVNLNALDSYGLPSAPRWWPDKFDPQTGEKITSHLRGTSWAWTTRAVTSSYGSPTAPARR